MSFGQVGRPDHTDIPEPTNITVSGLMSTDRIFSIKRGLFLKISIQIPLDATLVPVEQLYFAHARNQILYQFEGVSSP